MRSTPLSFGIVGLASVSVLLLAGCAAETSDANSRSAAAGGSGQSSGGGGAGAVSAGGTTSAGGSSAGSFADGGSASFGAGAQAGSSGGSSGGAQSSGGSAGSSSATCDAPISLGVINDSDGLNSDYSDSAPESGIFSGWFVYRDANHAGTVSPPTTEAVKTTGAGIEPGGSSGDAFHFAGAGLDQEFWGAGAGLWIATGSGSCVDLSSATGVKLWLQSDHALTLAVGTPATTESASGGTCAGGCINNKSPALMPKASGGVLEIPFSSFSGGSSGGSPVSLDKSRVTAIIFDVIHQNDMPWSFDVVIDDVAFY